MCGLYAGSNRFSIGGLLSLTEPSNLKTLIAQIKLILTKKRGFRSSHCLRWIASPFCQSEVLFCKVHFTSFSTLSIIIWVTSVCATSSGVDRTFKGCLQSSVVCFSLPVGSSFVEMSSFKAASGNFAACLPSQTIIFL